MRQDYARMTYMQGKHKANQVDVADSRVDWCNVTSNALTTQSGFQYNQLERKQ
jgi:hypothetical protein